jgi:hypothetical protein
MRKFINKIVNKGRKTAAVISGTVRNRRGEGYLDTAVKWIISIVLGGLILAALYALFNSTIIPELGSRISDMFSYAG